MRSSSRAALRLGACPSSSLWSAAGPDEDGGEVECGLVGKGEFVGPHGQAPPLLESGDAAFDAVALSVCLGVETGRATSSAPSPEAVTDLARRLWDDGPDAASTEMRADRAGGVRPVREDERRSSPWSPKSCSWNPDSGHDCLKGRGVTGLASSDMQSQRSRPIVTGQVDFRAQTTAGASECVIARF